MPAPRTSPRVPPRDVDTSRRSVVPQAAGRSLWFAAVWTGVGAAVAGAVVAIVVVAICWIPASGTSGHASSAIHAGLLTFLAALHSGVTVDASPTAFVPLGLTLLAGTITWRAGSGLADAADALGETDRRRLLAAGALQILAFTVCCLVAVPFATLGTSSAPLFGVGLGALLLAAVTAGPALVRSSPLCEVVSAAWTRSAGIVLRVAAGVLTVYLAGGALLVAGSLITHHDRVETISRAVGGGWSGVPVLVLGVLAAPNAAIGGAAYLSGPGVAVGSATATPFATAHGLLPAFPLLAAMPDGRGANALTWWLIIATVLTAGVVTARTVCAVPEWIERLRLLAVAAAVTAGCGLVLAWLGGGGVGDGALSTVGASPWQFGGALALVVVGSGGLVLALIRAWSWLDTGDSSLLSDLLAERLEPKPEPAPERVAGRTATRPTGVTPTGVAPTRVTPARTGSDDPPSAPRTAGDSDRGTAPTADPDRPEQAAG